MQITKTNEYISTPVKASQKPSALDVACYAVRLLEDNPLFNSGHGAVFTRDGVNELEASVMVSRGRKKRGVGVMGLRHVRNPILLAKGMLEHGDQDLGSGGQASSCAAATDHRGRRLDVPSAQGHTQVWGPAAEELARRYGLDMVDPGYFFTQQRWEEHVRALERERRGLGQGTWSAEEHLPQGTCGAVALDEDGIVCAATSTGGMTNKLTGRIGDTPVVGAGFWAEEWEQSGVAGLSAWERLVQRREDCVARSFARRALEGAVGRLPPYAVPLLSPPWGLLVPAAWRDGCLSSHGCVGYRERRLLPAHQRRSNRCRHGEMEARKHGQGLGKCRRSRWGVAAQRGR
ncbi:hypothetical protein J3458_000333 [Metarhizium acridum]|uniref:uncharacterized protein n=1 Tax=Metarhizium acridum TaxID=92637 RepID=UPI001C6A9CED|nr:hypothetical protein J3458_000333 [Metarhizium acridum]